MSVALRRGTPADAEACGKICYEAFKAISTHHNFPPDFPSPEVASGILSGLLSHPGCYAVVAERDGRIIGSNFLDERTSIAGVGPITVDPAVQDGGVGRELMRDVLDRAAERGAPGVRLVQDAFHVRSMMLYTKLGFQVREPLSVMQGAAIGGKVPGCDVRQAVEADLQACNQVCSRVHGHDRSGELLDAIRPGMATVVERHGRITGYATALGIFGHAVGEANDDVKALIAAASAFLGPGFLAPTRNSELLRWCLDSGLRKVKPMTLMTVGLYNEPAGAYLPSITF